MHRIVNMYTARRVSVRWCSMMQLHELNARLLSSKRWKADSFALGTLSEGDLSSDEVITRLKSLWHYCLINNIDLVDPENKIFSVQAWHLLQKVKDDDVTSKMSIDGIVDLLEAWNQFSRGWDKGLDGPSQTQINECARYVDNNNDTNKNRKEEIEITDKSISPLSSARVTMETRENEIDDVAQCKSSRRNINIPSKSFEVVEPDKNTVNNEYLLEPGVIPQPRSSPLDQIIDF